MKELCTVSVLSICLCILCLWVLVRFAEFLNFLCSVCNTPGHQKTNKRMLVVLYDAVFELSPFLLVMSLECKHKALLQTARSQALNRVCFQFILWCLCIYSVRADLNYTHVVASSALAVWDCMAVLNNLQINTDTSQLLLHMFWLSPADCIDNKVFCVICEHINVRNWIVYGQKYVDTWPSHPYVDLPQAVVFMAFRWGGVSVLDCNHVRFDARSSVTLIYLTRWWQVVLTDTDCSDAWCYRTCVISKLPTRQKQSAWYKVEVSIGLTNNAPVMLS